MTENYTVNPTEFELRMPELATTDREEKKIVFSSCYTAKYIKILSDIVLRIILFAITIALEFTPPFKRIIVDYTPYRYPKIKSFIPDIALWISLIFLPIIIILIVYAIRRNVVDLWQALLSFTLGLFVCGVINNTIKVIIGRPRPDFLARCGYNITAHYDPLNFVCHGKPSVINEGLKSFPSGHASFTFDSFAFIAFYLSGKLHTFDATQKRQTWKFCLIFTLFMIALLISISRISDYHHHTDDVTVGILIGLATSYISYRFYYPPLDSQLCHKPL